MQHVVSPAGSRGKLGGKSSGLLLAYHIVRRSDEYADAIGSFKMPKTWYVTSDGLLARSSTTTTCRTSTTASTSEIEQVRKEYPHIVQAFKNSELPKEVLKGLAVALDDIGDKPLIVRSSSLLEDRIGSAFSGKYKSLFLANRGEQARPAGRRVRRRRRGVREHLQPRPHRVPRRARPARPPRGDGRS